MAWEQSHLDETKLAKIHQQGQNHRVGKINFACNFLFRQVKRTAFKVRNFCWNERVLTNFEFTIPLASDQFRGWVVCVVHVWKDKISQLEFFGLNCVAWRFDLPTFLSFKGSRLLLPKRRNNRVFYAVFPLLHDWQSNGVEFGRALQLASCSVFDSRRLWWFLKSTVKVWTMNDTSVCHYLVVLALFIRSLLLRDGILHLALGLSQENRFSITSTLVLRQGNWHLDQLSRWWLFR